ncbi:hypothetical protein BU15DRAFT_67020 [Melanogaster broomeanus]|nr:hypothetical protein BU15DRAFT_67020 [Melanogaster broomeanus]
MAGQAKSKCKKQHTMIANQEEGLAYATKLWHEDQEKPEKDRRSLRAICCEATEEMKRREKGHVIISRATLTRRLEGGRSCQQANEENRGWLTSEEEESVVEFCVNLAARGFPLDHRRLKFHVDEILQARLAPGPSHAPQQPSYLGNDDPFIVLSTLGTSQRSPGENTTDWEIRRLGWHPAARDAVESLASTSASFLVDGTPLTSAHRLPQFMPSPITPTRHKCTNPLLNEEPANEKEHAYQVALHESYARKLAAQEEKRKKKKKGQLNGDGLPRLLTGDEFYNRVVAHQKACEEWRKAEKERKERNAVRRQAYCDAMHIWKEESDLAKQQRRWVAWEKPKLGKLEPVAPKPGSQEGEAGEVELEGENREVTEDEQSDRNDDGMGSNGESGEE